jgi:hypothetical protein
MFLEASFLFVRILMDVGGAYVFRFLAITVRLWFLAINGKLWFLAIDIEPNLLIGFIWINLFWFCSMSLIWRDGINVHLRCMFVLNCILPSDVVQNILVEQLPGRRALWSATSFCRWCLVLQLRVQPAYIEFPMSTSKFFWKSPM